MKNEPVTRKLKISILRFNPQEPESVPRMQTYEIEAIGLWLVHGKILLNVAMDALMDLINDLKAAKGTRCLDRGLDISKSRDDRNLTP